MAKNYGDMSYKELEAEKRKISAQIEELRKVVKGIARIMDSKQGELKLQNIAENLSPDDATKLKEML